MPLLDWGQRWPTASILFQKKRSTRRDVKEKSGNEIPSQQCYSRFSREKGKHVCLLRWPVAPSLLPTPLPQITGHQVTKGLLLPPRPPASNSNSCELGLPRSHGRNFPMAESEQPTFKTSQGKIGRFCWSWYPGVSRGRCCIAYSPILPILYKNPRENLLSKLTTHSINTLTCTPVRCPVLPRCYFYILPAFTPLLRESRQESEYCNAEAVLLLLPLTPNNSSNPKRVPVELLNLSLRASLSAQPLDWTRMHLFYCWLRILPVNCQEISKDTI